MVPGLHSDIRLHCLVYREGSGQGLWHGGLMGMAALAESALTLRNGYLSYLNVGCMHPVMGLTVSLWVSLQSRLQKEMNLKHRKWRQMTAMGYVYSVAGTLCLFHVLFSNSGRAVAESQGTFCLHWQWWLWVQPLLLYCWSLLQSSVPQT